MVICLKGWKAKNKNLKHYIFVDTNLNIEGIIKMSQDGFYKKGSNSWKRYSKIACKRAF